MRDEGGSQRGARFADEGFVSGDIPCIRAGIEFALDRAAYGDARKTEERERHQHGFDSGMNQREEEGREHERQQEGRKPFSEKPSHKKPPKFSLAPMYTSINLP